jgi:hypothetical protein
MDAMIESKREANAFTSDGPLILITGHGPICFIAGTDLNRWSAK